MVTHKVNVKEGIRPNKQTSRPELEMHIREETQKLLDVDFIKPIHHTTWLANVVPVKKKKNG